MEAQEKQQNLEPEDKKTREHENKKTHKKDRFTWWQTLLILVTTLVVTIGVSYYVSNTYLWPKYDTNELNSRLAAAKATADAKPNEPKSHVDLGYANFLLKNYDEAVNQYKLAIDLDKNDFDAYFNLGLTYNEQGRYNDAVEQAQKATELSPKDYKGWLLKGMAYRHLKMYSDAIKALNEANHLMATNTDIINEIGRVAEDQGDKKNAAEIYKTALSYDPMYKPAIDGLKRVTNK